MSSAMEAQAREYIIDVVDNEKP